MTIDHTSDFCMACDDLDGMKLRAAARDAVRARALVKVALPEASAQGDRAARVDFDFALDRAALKRTRRRESRYQLRSNLTESDPVRLWEFYSKLADGEAAFKDLKGDLAIRPIFHQNEARIEAQIFVAFMAYCLHVTLKQLLKQRAPGLTPRVLLEKRRAMQLLDVHFPTTDGREIVFTRYTEPDPQLLLAQLRWTPPQQARPRISARDAVALEYRPSRSGH